MYTLCTRLCCLPGCAVVCRVVWLLGFRVYNWFHSAEPTALMGASPQEKNSSLARPVHLLSLCNFRCTRRTSESEISAKRARRSSSDSLNSVRDRRCRRVASYCSRSTDTSLSTAQSSVTGRPMVQHGWSPRMTECWRMCRAVNDTCFLAAAWLLLL